MKLEYSAVKKGGKLHIRNRKIFDAEVSQFKDGQEFELTLEKKRSKRSENQNRYYFSVIVGLIRERFNELGHDVSKQETHEFLKSKFNVTEFVNEKTGEVISIPRSTTEMNKSEFLDYTAKISQWSAEVLELVIPEPNSQMAAF